MTTLLRKLVLYSSLAVLLFAVIGVVLVVSTPSAHSNSVPISGQTTSSSSTETTPSDNANSNTQASSNETIINNAETDYENCLSDAKSNYQSALQSDCLDEVQGNPSYGCAIPLTLRSDLLTAYENDKSICEAHYQATVSAAN